MKSFARTSALRMSETWNLFKQADGTWRSRTYATMALSLGDLTAGDVIDVRLDHEFSTAISGAGYWTVNGVQSEHWSCWVMASTAVLFGTEAQLGSPGVELVGGGTYVIPPQETNWDWYIHHLGISRSQMYRVATDFPNAYLWSRVYFKSGAVYTPSTGGQITVHGTPYPALTAEVR